MNDDAAKFVGDIPKHYDQAMGPIIFVDYATAMAERVVAFGPARVLETAAGTALSRADCEISCLLGHG